MGTCFWSKKKEKRVSTVSGVSRFMSPHHKKYLKCAHTQVECVLIDFYCMHRVSVGNGDIKTGYWLMDELRFEMWHRFPRERLELYITLILLQSGIIIHQYIDQLLLLLFYNNGWGHWMIHVLCRHQCSHVIRIAGTINSNNSSWASLCVHLCPLSTFQAQIDLVLHTVRWPLVKWDCREAFTRELHPWKLMYYINFPSCGLRWMQQLPVVVSRVHQDTLFVWLHVFVAFWERKHPINVPC